MVSGIGPEETLRQHDIPVISASPGVGQNMWDHVLFGVIYEANLTTSAVLKDPAVAADYTTKYLANATGILASQNADYLGPSLPHPDFSNNTTKRLTSCYRMGETSC
jgi:choline dehydrogenase